MSTKEDLMLAEIADLRNRIYRSENPVFNGRLDSWQAACGKARGESESLRNELRELKAEIAGLKTGYEAYERVNAELKTELKKVDSDRKACWAEFKVQGRRLDELKAENEALRKALMDAEYRIDQGKVWTENGWMYAGLSQQGQMKALEILREATKLKLNNHSYIHQYRGTKITKPIPPNKPSEPIVRRVVNEKVINANEVKP